MCHPFADHGEMERKPRYRIPAGIKVEIRNVKEDGRLRQHVTRSELLFADRANTGYDGKIFYFEYGSWVISVNADLVQ